MSQNWIVVDLDAHVLLEEGGTLDEHFWGNDGLDLDSFHVPCTNDRINIMLSGRFTHQRVAPLLRLPPELLHQILEFLNPTETYSPGIFLFAVTCKFALVLAQPHIVRLQQRHFAPLARHRLVCIGSSARTLANYPVGLFDQDEQRRLMTGSALADNSSSPGDHSDVSLYDLATETWKRYVPDPPSLVRPLDILWRPSAVSRMSAPDFERFRALTMPHRPNDAPWVLCSHSKREYVRAEAVSPVHPMGLGYEQVRGVDWKYRQRNLVRALLTCICWSPDATTNMLDAGEGTPVNRELTRGRWAGDRIELTTLNGMEGGKLWIDVTDDVVKVLQSLWDGVKHDHHRDVALEADFDALYARERDA
ncbi:hypothetical protein C8Q78DRAFT_683811 [Trametes maxima]|nr:hypothetical protein C8Q78DRAFT_683811 [Trametes maxima]